MICVIDGRKDRLGIRVRSPTSLRSIRGTLLTYIGKCGEHVDDFQLRISSSTIFSNLIKPVPPIVNA